MKNPDEISFIIFSVFVALVYGLVRLLRRLIFGGNVKTYKKEPEKSEKKGSSKPFFVKSLTRRRRLDLTRKHDNVLSGKLGKKMDRHRRGMFGK